MLSYAPLIIYFYALSDFYRFLAFYGLCLSSDSIFDDILRLWLTSLSKFASTYFLECLRKIMIFTKLRRTHSLLLILTMNYRYHFKLSSASNPSADSTDVFVVNGKILIVLCMQFICIILLLAPLLSMLKNFYTCIGH